MPGFCFPNEWMINSTTANENARIGDVKCRPGIGVADVQVKKEKIDHVSVYSRRSVRFPRIPARRSASDYIPPRIRSPVSNQQNCHDDHRDDGIMTKKVLLPLKDPKAAPVLVTLTRLKKSATTMRAS